MVLYFHLEPNTHLLCERLLTQIFFFLWWHAFFQLYSYLPLAASFLSTSPINSKTTKSASGEEAGSSKVNSAYTDILLVELAIM